MSTIKRKIVRVLFCMLVLFLALMVKGSVQASYDVTYNDIDYSLPDLPVEDNNFNENAFSIYKLDDNTFYLISYVGYDETKFRVYHSAGTEIGVGVYPIEEAGWDNYIGKYCPDCRFRFFVSTNGSAWVYDSSFSGYSTNFDINNTNHADKFIYSNVDIYEVTWENGNWLQTGNVFFQHTPQETILAPIVEEKQETMKMTLQEIILILPMILVVVVSLVGLRKALQMLSNLLHQS